MSAQPSYLAGFVSRVGGVLVEPRATFDDLLDGERGGLGDLALLLGLQIVAVHLPHLVRILWFAAAVDPAAGVMNLLNLLFNALLVPLLAALSGGVVLGAVAAKVGAAGSNKVERSRLNDLACLAVVPMVALQAVAAAALRFSEGVVVIGTSVFMGGLVWFVVLMVIAIRLVRGRGARESAS